MTTLLTIQHDPEGKLLEPLSKVLPLINDLFSKCVLVVTESTSFDYQHKLFPWFVDFKIPNGMAQARRDVTALGLRAIDDNYYFYCDLDRLIYWATNYPDELRETVSKIQGKDYTVIGRNHMAFVSHPLFQMETETVMNLVVREKAGLDMDVFAGARGLSYQAAKWISEQSTVDHGAQDIEWPLIIKENGGTIGYIVVNGLAYESGALDIRRSREDEFNLRMTNLRSVLEFLG